MNVWWKFQCEDNHFWEVYVRDGAELGAGADECPVDGLEAVTAHRMPQADRVRLTLAPAAAIDDDVRGHLNHEREYFLEIERWDESETLRSAAAYDWEEALRRLGRFRDLTWDQAVNRWRRTMGRPTS